MIKIILEKYKVVNIILCAICTSIFLYINTNYKIWFHQSDIDFIYKYWDGIYHPLMLVTMWLAGIVGVLLFLPSHIFKTWLFFIAPPILFITYVLVQRISVYSGNPLNPTRAQMTENGMVVLAVVTAVFVLGCLVSDWRKKK